jgi:alpha-galactosidase/6-phospho-beta-glucosidase family protein
VTGDRAFVHKALLTHPLVAQDIVSVELVDRLLEADARHLPQFQAGSRV